MFWLSFSSWSYVPNFNFWDISSLTYWFYFWDIILLIATFFFIISIFSIDITFENLSSFKSKDFKVYKENKKS